MGYFNAHCHLELSHLRGMIRPGLSFVDWLAQLVALKRVTDVESSRAAAAAALERAGATGTTAIGDILSLDTSAGILTEGARSAQLRAILFWELLEFHPEKTDHVFERLDARQASIEPTESLASGLSPHAPYTTNERLLREAARRAAAAGAWLCIHAAETREETEFLLSGRGPLRDFLAPALPPGWEPPGMRPVAWLDYCGCLGPRTLLVHCNDIDDGDVRMIRERRASVVVCPGSHVYFGRGDFPLARLLDAGIDVYMGTDSLASNEDLDMAREVAIACDLTPGVSRERIAALADAARAGAFLR